MALGSTQDPKMSDAEFRMISELLKSRCGLHFDEDSRFLVEKRVARRVHENEVGSFAAYHYLLRNGSAGEEEFAALIDSITTNETYFFREVGQLRTLIDEVVPELIIRRRQLGGAGPVTIWSAGCSSGEEPYSVVAMALEAGLEPGRDLRVYASDISRAMLTKSRRGIYREASFRETSPHLREKYFVEKDGLHRIRDELKKHVDFIHLNLMDRERIALLGSMDIVLCRNVIIYFDLETKKKVIEIFYQKLRPGGYLFLGHSESLINISSAFELKHLKNDLVYRRPSQGDEVSDPWHELAGAAIERTDSGRGSDDQP
jgi:chemotaxis protein methyltransferase CheR